MTEKEKQLVIIKGTKEGLVFFLDDDCAFRDLLGELRTKLAAADYYHDQEQQTIPVILKVGHRYIHPEQKDQLKDLIEQDRHFIIERYDTMVIGKEEAEEWFDQSEIKMITQIVRSGQVVEVTGDLLLIGDVNPGGHIKATGSIYILGKLQGIAHAGMAGNEQAVIAASFMNPTQLRIAKFLSRAPDYEAEGVYMECGYLDKENHKIAIDRIQVLPYILKGFKAMERRMLSG